MKQIRQMRRLTNIPRRPLCPNLKLCKCWNSHSLPSSPTRYDGNTDGYKGLLTCKESNLVPPTTTDIMIGLPPQSKIRRRKDLHPGKTGKMRTPTEKTAAKAMVRRKHATTKQRKGIDGSCRMTATTKEKSKVGKRSLCHRGPQARNLEITGGRSRRQTQVGRNNFLTSSSKDRSGRSKRS